MASDDSPSQRDRVHIPPSIRRQDSGVRRLERLRTEIEAVEEAIRRLRSDVAAAAQRVSSLSEEIRRRSQSSAEAAELLRPAAGALARWTLSVRVVRDAAQQAANESLMAAVSTLEERCAAAPDGTMADLRRALACTKHAAEFDHAGVDTRFQGILLACTLEDQRDAARRLLTAHERILAARAAAGSGSARGGTGAAAAGGAWSGVPNDALATMAVDLVDELHTLRQRWESTRGTLDGVRDSGELDTLPSHVEQDELRATIARLVARLHTVAVQYARRAQAPASPAASSSASAGAVAAGFGSAPAVSAAAAAAGGGSGPATGGAGSGSARTAATAAAMAADEADPVDDPVAAAADAGAGAVPAAAAGGAGAGAASASAPGRTAAQLSISGQLSRFVDCALDQALQLTHTARTLRAEHAALLERLDLLADMEELAVCHPGDRANLVRAIEAVRTLLSNMRMPGVGAHGADAAAAGAAGAAASAPGGAAGAGSAAGAAANRKF